MAQTSANRAHPSHDDIFLLDLSCISYHWRRFPLKAGYLSTIRRARIAVCVPFGINAMLCTIFFHMKTAVEQYDKRKGNTFYTSYKIYVGILGTFSQTM